MDKMRLFLSVSDSGELWEEFCIEKVLKSASGSL
jgi:hypothetical protein